MKRLKNKVAIVTGATSGLGRAIVLLFAAESASVIAADKDKEALQKLSEEVSNMGETLTTVTVNMLNPDHIDHMIAVAVLTHGTVDILVNNAETMDEYSPVAEVKDDMWWRVMETNLNGTFRAMRTTLKIMLKNKSGAIINIAMLGGAHNHTAGAAYTASKHAIIGLSKNTSSMYARSGIRCSVITDVIMESDNAIVIDKALPMVSEKDIRGTILNPFPQGNEEIANIALTLASEDTNILNGAVITADKGWSAY